MKIKIIQEGFIEPERLTISPNNVRKTGHLINIEILKESIKNIGIIRPVVINSKYQVVVGGRRLIASLELGLPKIPYIMKEYNSDVEEVVDSLIENDTHEPLDVDSKIAMRKLYELGMSEEEIGRALGRRIVVNPNIVSPYREEMGPNGYARLVPIHNNIEQLTPRKFVFLDEIREKEKEKKAENREVSEVQCPMDIEINQSVYKRFKRLYSGKNRIFSNKNEAIEHAILVLLDILKKERVIPHECFSLEG